MYLLYVICILFIYILVINKHYIVNELGFEWCVCVWGGGWLWGGIGDGGGMTNGKNIMGGW